MEELNLEYYFKNMGEFSEKELFNNCVEVWEPLKKLKEYVNEKIVEKASDDGEPSRNCRRTNARIT